jgi:hypothetical protein
MTDVGRFFSGNSTLLASRRVQSDDSVISSSESFCFKEERKSCRLMFPERQGKAMLATQGNGIFLCQADILVTQVKYPRGVMQQDHLIVECGGCCRQLLYHGGVLLSNIVELGNGTIDLLDAGRLLPASRVDLVE